MASSKGARRARLILYDALAVPRQEVNLIADLLEEGVLTHSGVGGEILLFLHEGRSLGRSMTGGDGRAVKPLVPAAIGESALSVRLLNPARVMASDATARLYVWNPRRPLVLIFFSALIRPSTGMLPLPSLTNGTALADPEKSAIAMLSRVAPRFGLIYLSDADRFELSAVRQWVERHQLPLGPIFLQQRGGQALANQLDRLKREGWTKIRAGLTATPEEAKILLTRKVPAVAPPFAVSRDKWPEKAIKPKDWEDAGKKL